MLYLTAGDRRVRKEHKRWDYILLPFDDPFWRTHYPPNGWRCRCKVVSLSDYDIEQRGLIITHPNTVAEHMQRVQTVNDKTGEILNRLPGIDLGWDYNPGQAWLGPDVALGKSLVQHGQGVRAASIPQFNAVIEKAAPHYIGMVNSVAARVAMGKVVDDGKIVTMGHLSAGSIARIMTQGPLATSLITISSEQVAKLLRSGLSIESLYKALSTITATGAYFARTTGGLVELKTKDLVIMVELSGDMNKVIGVKN